MIAALSRFVSKAANRSLPFFKALKKSAGFQWTAECENALAELKQILSAPPVLTKPEKGEVLYLYLAVAEETVSAVLIRETSEGQRPVYFVSKVLQGAEPRYQKIEKIALALVVAARRLRPYFVAHQIVVRTDQPIRQILHRPDLAGRIIKWAVELSEFGIKYEARSALKAQVLADFVAEMTPVNPESSSIRWILHVDGSSNSKGSGAGLILENSEGLVVEVSLSFSFGTSNNQAEYEACIAGLKLAADFGARTVELNTDSLLVVSQVKNEFVTNEPILQRYLTRLRELFLLFEEVNIKHVPRAENARADVLSKLASTKKAGNLRSIIQETLTRPSVQLHAVSAAGISTASAAQSWINPIRDYIEHGTEPPDRKEAAILRRQSASYSLISGRLFRRGFSTPLLKCVEKDEAAHILEEIHEGVCGHHLGSRALAKRALRAGYYWPTMCKDAADYVKKCDTCQRYADVHNAPPSELVSLTSSWPFMQWGIDLLGPFSPGRGGVKYLIVAVDYLTKWIEAEPLAHITAANCIRFFKKTILTRFGVPATVITDNGTQFADKGFRALMRDLGIRHHFTSVEHPQTNGQVESANKVILRGLKRKLNGAKGAWPEELPYVLWAYRTTPHSTTNETPFRMAYGTEAMLPVELSQATWRTLFRLSPEDNERASREELDLVEEVRDSARIAQAAVKARVSKRYNQKVVLREFDVGDLVLRRADVGNKNAREGKLAPNWEGPYRITMKTGTGAYHLETLSKEPIERTWNATKLRAYYS